MADAGDKVEADAERGRFLERAGDFMTVWVDGSGVVRVETREDLVVGAEPFSLIIFLGGAGGVGFVDCKSAPTLAEVIYERSLTLEDPRELE